jgi:hypothetical protein
MSHAEQVTLALIDTLALQGALNFEFPQLRFTVHVRPRSHNDCRPFETLSVLFRFAAATATPKELYVINVKVWHSEALNLQRLGKTDNAILDLLMVRPAIAGIREWLTDNSDRH